MTPVYQGRCPVCGGRLFLENEILTCALVPGHFEIKQKVFEAAWEKYDAEVMSGESLLRILRNSNTAPDKPDMTKG